MAGIDPREMAAAPLKSGNAPKPKTNRYASLFVGLTFKTPPTSKVYENDGGDRKTRKLANVLVELSNGAGFIRGGVKAVLVKGRSKPSPEFTMFATQHQGCFVVEDEGAKRDFQEWKDTIVIPAFVEWRKGNGGDTIAPAASGVELDGVDFS